MKNNENVITTDFIKNFIDESKLSACKKALNAPEIDLNYDGIYEDFAEEFEKVITLVRLQSSGELYIFNLKGYYELASDYILQAIVKYLLNESGYTWSPSSEKRIYGAIKRDSTKTIESFNAVNAVNFRNGVFFLDNGNFKAGVSDKYYFSYILDYDYNPKTTCPQFLKFINETSCNDKDWIAVIQEVLGYCLSNETKAEKAFFLYGNGSNGKSVLANLISKLVGEELTCSIPLEALNKDFGIQDMIGKHLNICAENEQFPSSQKFKTVISSDKMNIPVKYKPDWVGRLMIKNIFLMNSLPPTPDITYGFFRKILIIPFNNTVTPDKINVNLNKELVTELTGIFNWAYEGYKRLVSNNYNFTTCKVIDNCMREYAERENPTASFFNSTYKYCEGRKIARSNLHKDYLQWASNNGYESMSRNKFHSALAVKSEEDENINLEYRKYQGIYYLMNYDYIVNVDDETDTLDFLYQHNHIVDYSDLDEDFMDEE